MSNYVESYEAAQPWLARIGFEDPKTAHRNLLTIANGNGVTPQLILPFCEEIAECLPSCPDPDRAWNNLERMLARVDEPARLIHSLLSKPQSLAVLTQMFAASQYFSDLIIANPDYFDFLWESGSSPLDPVLLRELLLTQALPRLDDDPFLLALIRQHRHRELLRIGYRDIALGEPLDRITESISDLADCMVQVALTLAYRREAARYGEPRSPDGKLSRLTVIALGKLGGRELNYSSDIDLILIYDAEGFTDGKRKLANSEFFANVTRRMVRLLSANTPHGQAYRVDLRLRPHGGQSSLCLSLANTLAYYDKHGRTWERQALVKARAIAGSAGLGREFLEAIESFIYRRYLTYVEINEIKAIKRQIEAKTRDAGTDSTNLKTGHGGIRDIEFVIQFLQLLYGGSIPQVRDGNTLKALQKLVTYGCINQDEHAALETGYRFLRKAEHRLQFMFDLQTHSIPADPDELDTFAQRLGYLADEVRPGEQFRSDLRTVAERNRSILTRLLHDLFIDDEKAQPGSGEPETDLLLDPQPSQETLERVLGRYRFSDVQAAYRNLSLLAREEVPFLSSVRCRHFLAGIAPQLVRAIADTPDPDMALVNLEKVAASLGAKGVLWESCSVNPPFLKLFVNLCSWSQFLSEILINNPGMIDELLDALVFNKPPTLDELVAQLQGLLKGAREIDPILHSFKNTRLLGISINDIQSKQTLRETTRALSELAEAVIRCTADLHFQELCQQYGRPMVGGNPVGHAILGLGKFGGKELGYHGDLDLVLVYEAEGFTVPPAGGRSNASISHQEFYTQLAQRIVKTVGQMGPLGRIYPIDFRLRPTGHSGNLAVPLEWLRTYYSDPVKGAALWERMAMTRARVVHGDERFGDLVLDSLRESIGSYPWSDDSVTQVLQMRQRLENSRGTNDLKRGVGGVMDIEFAVQVAQIRLGSQYPHIMVPSVWSCLERVSELDLWPRERVRTLLEGYTFLRSVESRLRIVHNLGRDDLPADEKNLQKLAYRLGYTGPAAGEQLTTDVRQHTRNIRAAFLECLRS